MDSIRAECPACIAIVNKDKQSFFLNYTQLSKPADGKLFYSYKITLEDKKYCIYEGPIGFTIDSYGSLKIDAKVYYSWLDHHKSTGYCGEFGPRAAIFDGKDTYKISYTSYD